MRTGDFRTALNPLFAGLAGILGLVVVGSMLLRPGIPRNLAAVGILRQHLLPVPTTVAAPCDSSGADVSRAGASRRPQWACWLKTGAYDRIVAEASSSPCGMDELCLAEKALARAMNSQDWWGNWAQAPQWGNLALSLAENPNRQSDRVSLLLLAAGAFTRDPIDPQWTNKAVSAVKRAAQLATEQGNGKVVESIYHMGILKTPCNGQEVYLAYGKWLTEQGGNLQEVDRMFWMIREERSQEVCFATAPAIVLMQLGGAPLAFKYLQLADRIAPNDAEVAYLWGRYYANMTQASKAEQAYRRAVMLALPGNRPVAAGALRGLFKLVRDQGRCPQGVTLEKQVSHWDTDQAQFWALLGDLLAACGEFDGARASYQTALDIDPGTASARSALAGLGLR